MCDNKSFTKTLECESKRPSLLEKNKKELRTLQDQITDSMSKTFITINSFEVYGGVAGLYDYGPAGCALKNNIISLWRRHFVLEEDMLEVDCSSLTPEPVLKASGHVDKFSDLMVRDTINGNCYRADKLIESQLSVLSNKDKGNLINKEQIQSIINNIDTYSQDQIDEIINKYQILSPEGKNKLSPSFPFNLMFQTQIGPTGKIPGFLRPETAQGIFVNFKRLLNYNNGKIPFAAAQIGNAYRNEIAPRTGLIRVREFCLAEIEHFVHPQRKIHPRYNEVKQLVIPLLSREEQEDQKFESNPRPTLITIEEAVDKKIIGHQLLAYYLARSYLFLERLGLDMRCVRFRQHRQNEMAHYASDCWDAECYCSYGWIECIGHSDRGTFDMMNHVRESKQDFSVSETLEEPRLVQKYVITYNNKEFGKTFRQKASQIKEYLSSLPPDTLSFIKQTLSDHQTYSFALGNNLDTQTFQLTESLLSINLVEEKQFVTSYLPNVIEPSFGIGRILYCLLEHIYWSRSKDIQRKIFSFPSLVAPIKCYIMPLYSSGVKKEDIENLVQLIYKHMIASDISCRIDKSTAAIGRRYARSDELGVPFAVTIDSLSILQNQSNSIPTVTIRERDSCQQIRIQLSQLYEIMKQLVNQTYSWSEAYNKFEHQFVKELE